MKIKLEFKSENAGYDRVVVTLTHYDNKSFKGVITEDDANIINMAISLHNLDNPHGMSFYGSERDVLFVTFKLKLNMSL